MKLVKGAQSIAYDRAPYLISSASVVGKKEGEGPIGEMFDLVGESDLFGENTWPGNQGDCGIQVVWGVGETHPPYRVPNPDIASQTYHWVQHQSVVA